MNSLIDSTNKTPIEIALGIDAEGMTTARKLYEFLELHPAAYARWFKTNIIENQFAAENEDFFPFNTNVECGGQASKDAKLTAHFAKKLSVQGKTARAEEAREYFTRLEEKVKETAINRKQLSPELQMFAQMLDAMAKSELEQKRQSEHLQKVEQRVESIRNVVAIDTTSWRDETGKILRRIGNECGDNASYQDVRKESYQLLEKRMGVNLKQRLTNKRRRMADEGVCKSQRDKLNNLDIISEDKKLIEGYMAIVKELAIKYRVA